MSIKLSPAAKAQIADAVADLLEAEAAADGANPRLRYYATKLRDLASKIFVQLGRTGAWREARGAAKGRLAKADELVDHWIRKLYHALEDDAGLVLNDPARARRAEELLDALFPLLTLAALIGLRPDREVGEVDKLLATARSEAVRRSLEELGFWPMIEALDPALAEEKAAIEERKRQVRSEAPEGTATEIAAKFDKLWKQLLGFLADAYDEDVPAEAALVERIQTPYTEAVAKLEALRQAAATRNARAAEAATAGSTPATSAAVLEPQG